MTQAQPETRGYPLGGEARFCLCENYARVTERAALAGARWLGRAEQETAEEEATRPGPDAVRMSLQQPAGVLDPFLAANLRAALVPGGRQMGSSSAI